VAATLPTTIPERRVLGPAKQRLYEAAETAGQKMAEAAAERVMGTVKEEVKEVVREVAGGIVGGGEENPPG
jgi:phosphoribosyl-ATP pyrophosphohydrolase